MESLTLNNSLKKNINPPAKQFLWAVLTLFFFLPLGIVAIVNLIKVSNLLAKGFYDEAKQTAFFVKIITIIGMTVGFVTYLSLALILGSIYLMAI